MHKRREILEVVEVLRAKGSFLASKKVTTGFDGFVDTIVTVIKNKDKDNFSTPFTTLAEFGNYVVEKGSTSFSLEVEQQKIKLGGNMPILSHALGELGVHVNCVGALGHPQTARVFEAMSGNCHLYSFAEPGTATAFEFNDGKIMVANMGTLNSLGWDQIKDTLGISTLISLYQKSDVFCFVNWSEIDSSTEVWKGILKDVLPKCETAKRPIAFFDLSDCSKRSPTAIGEALALLKEFSRHATTVLSLNKNEARSVQAVFRENNSSEDLIEYGKTIFEFLGIETLVLHSPKECVTVSSQGIFQWDAYFVDHPMLSTGAGDHFNAGFVAAQLIGQSPTSSLILASAVASIYVKSGTSPSLSDVISFLETQ